MSFSGTFELRPSHWQGGWFGRQIYEFTNDHSDPATWSDGSDIIRPDNHFYTDLGSTPKTLQTLAPKWFAKDRYPASFIFHDSAYLHGGAWFAVKGGWVFREFSKSDADRYLRLMIQAEGGGRINARLIWTGVAIGGWLAWRRKKPDRPQGVL